MCGEGSDGLIIHPSINPGRRDGLVIHPSIRLSIPIFTPATGGPTRLNHDSQRQALGVVVVVEHEGVGQFGGGPQEEALGEAELCWLVVFCGGGGGARRGLCQGG